REAPFPVRPQKGKFTLLARYTHESRGHRSTIELRRYPGGGLFEVEVLPDGNESAHQVGDTYARVSFRLRGFRGSSNRHLTPEGEDFLARKRRRQTDPPQELKKARTTSRRKTGG